jgi:hypothetical protein
LSLLYGIYTVMCQAKYDLCNFSYKTNIDVMMSLYFLSCYKEKLKIVKKIIICHD